MVGTYRLIAYLCIVESHQSLTQIKPVGIVFWRVSPPLASTYRVIRSAEIVRSKSMYFILPFPFCFAKVHLFSETAK